MNASEVIESYVRDVAACLPRRLRNDVAFELRVLLDDELAARAQTQGRDPDKAMAVDLLRGFGRPAEAARRYHERPAVIDPADTHHFAIWALAGAVVLSVLSAVDPNGTMGDGGMLFLTWLGVLVVCFALGQCLRHHFPAAMEWKPKREAHWMPRRYALLSLIATLVFPVFMYAMPQTFVRVAFFGVLSDEGLKLTPEFSQSWLRAATMTVLLGVVAIYSVLTVRRGWHPKTRWTSSTIHILLGLLLVAHSAPITAVPGTEPFMMFESSHANMVAMPIFGLVGACTVLFALYDAYREWSRIRPAPAGANAHA